MWKIHLEMKVPGYNPAGPPPSLWPVDPPKWYHKYAWVKRYRDKKAARKKNWMKFLAMVCHADQEVLDVIDIMTTEEVLTKSR